VLAGSGEFYFFLFSRPRTARQERFRDEGKYEKGEKENQTKM
jgi:hypothetical protein